MPQDAKNPCKDENEGPVAIECGGNGVTVDPDSVCVPFGKKLKWTIIAGDDVEVDIEFESKNGIRGPFKKKDGQDERGKFKKKGPGDEESGVAEKPGAVVETWKYDVRCKKGNTTHKLDPEVRVRR